MVARSAEGKADGKNVVQSVAKAFAVLRAFGPELPELTISEVAEAAGIDRGTSFRLLHTLCDLGFVAQVPNSKRFRLTLKCLELGYTALAHARLRDVARPLLNDLLAEVADAASLGMLDGPDVVYIERLQGDLGARHVDRRVGSRTGIYAAALGQAILAFAPVESQRAVLEMAPRVKLSERTITDVGALLERLAEIRARGWALSDGENAYGLRTVAAPIFDASGKAIAGISATIRAERWDLDTFVKRAVPRVLAATSQLSAASRLSFGEVTRQVGR
jgi:IclR family pca regulon transcriptional regulator